MDIIAVENLVKRYDDLLALDHFNLHVTQGEIFGLLGPNGSGKTTSINCMLALLTYDRGTIRLFGEPMDPARYDLKRRIGVVPQQVAVINELTVHENIDYFCSLYVSDRTRRRTLVDEAIEFVGLEEFAAFRPGKLSGGLLRRLNIACGIAHKPELIFFDEPTVAVDPQSRNSILTGIQRLRSEGATVVYTSHYMEEVEQICDRVMIMDHGRALAQGTCDELKRSIKTGERIVVELQTASGTREAAASSIDKRELDRLRSPTSSTSRSPTTCSPSHAKPASTTSPTFWRRCAQATSAWGASHAHRPPSTTSSSRSPVASCAIKEKRPCGPPLQQPFARCCTRPAPWCGRSSSPSSSPPCSTSCSSRCAPKSPSRPSM